MDTTQARVQYVRGKNFKALVIKTTLLTVLTLGIYRFWKYAALRRYYWSAVHIRGNSLEYRGTGLEAFLGFLIVLLIISIYLGVIVAFTAFLGIVSMQNLQWVQTIVIFAMIPFSYLAVYRFRRYIYGRTRWRGIRFGLQKGAWGYMWRSLFFLFLNMLTLGLLSPFGRFRLEKYVADRMYLGTEKFHQYGKWTDLYRYYWPILFGWLVVCILIFGVTLLMMVSNPNFYLTPIFPLMIMGLFLFGYVILGLFYGYYAAGSQRYLLAHKTLGKTIHFQVDFSTAVVVRKYVVGILITLAIVLLFIGGVFLIFSLIGGGFDWINKWAASTNALNETGAMTTEQTVVFLIVLVLFNFIIGAIMQISKHIFINQPVASYIADGVIINNAEDLDKITQNNADNIADADGFADALDVGFGF